MLRIASELPKNEEETTLEYHRGGGRARLVNPSRWGRFLDACHRPADRTTLYPPRAGNPASPAAQPGVAPGGLGALCGGQSHGSHRPWPGVEARVSTWHALLYIIVRSPGRDATIRAWRARHSHGATSIADESRSGRSLGIP